MRSSTLVLFLLVLGKGTLLFSVENPSLGDTVWTGAVGAAWADPANWSKGLPSEKGVANTVIQNSPRNITPVITTTGNSSHGQVYIMSGGGLVIQKGGELTTGGNFVTGNNGHAGMTIVTGGTLNIGGVLLIGHNGFEGSLKIDAGTINAEGLSIHEAGAAKVFLVGAGKLVLPNSEENLRNVRYWIDNSKLITAQGTDASMEYSVDVDTEKKPGKIVISVWSGK
ncbi:MAG: hypothetical protein EBQ51_00050 [Verrucomicrobia bacterium]|nr:hypothetical protein [Verrucomicrobiota bacterium]